MVPQLKRLCKCAREGLYLVYNTIKGGLQHLTSVQMMNKSKKNHQNCLGDKLQELALKMNKIRH